MLVFLVFGWAIARRLHRPPALWSRQPAGLGVVLARSWRGLIGIGVGLYAIGLEIAITGYVPGVTDPDLALAICWGALLAMLPVFTLALAGASQPVQARRQVTA